jgi:hypothetical protein
MDPAAGAPEIVLGILVLTVWQSLAALYGSIENEMVTQISGLAGILTC